MNSSGKLPPAASRAQAHDLGLYPTTVQGRLIGMALMFVGIDFLSLLTAAVASRFVKQERGDEHDEVMDTLRQIQADVAELKSRTR